MRSYSDIYRTINKRRAALPLTEPEREAKIASLGRKAKILRELRPNDPRVRDAITEMIDAGYTVREYDGPRPRRWPLHEAWGGKEPPEIP